MIAILLAFFLAISGPKTASDSLETPFERSNGRETATYEQAIRYYRLLDKRFSQVKMFREGETDSGIPLHLVVISSGQTFSPPAIRAQNKRIVLIDNGIHPGEPCGIDASMMLARDLMINPELHKLLTHVVVCIIPVYNIGGALNRNSHTRANQIGPQSYGFRGNARNLDLDRDFIKADSRNARSFTRIFHQWNPDVFADTHTSDGADYQYTMTLISTQKDKFQSTMSRYLEHDFDPAIYAMMNKTPYMMTPYVESKGASPDSGIIGFPDTPRYSSGYAALFNTLSFITESHMLKPFFMRVRATYTLLKDIITVTNRDYEKIGQLRKQADEEVSRQQVFHFGWQLDTTQFRMIGFKGYEALYRTSHVTGHKQLYYDEHKPYDHKIPYYDTYKPTIAIQKPYAFLIPQAWYRTIERLKLNGVKMSRLATDTTLRLATRHIENYKTSRRAYEGHYIHRDPQYSIDTMRVRFRKGDYLIKVNQPENRYIMEVLEPKAVDSFFNWNFFDTILMQKEYFSSYVFDTTAYRLLQQHPDLKERFDAMKKSDPAFAANPRKQLDFIYRHSPYLEKSYLRYPVYRIEHKIDLRLHNDN